MDTIFDTCKRDGCRVRMDGLKMCDMRVSETNYEKLFGTPEKAAKTIAGLNCEGICEGCSLYGYGCFYQDEPILEWLESEAE